MAANSEGPETVDLAMVACYPRREEAQALAVEGGLAVDDLHMTLVFLGDASTLEPDQVTAAVGLVAMSHEPLAGIVGGTGYFSATENGVPAILLPDVQNLGRVREDVVGELRDRGIESPSEHGFVPHVTQIYVESSDETGGRESFIGQELHFDALSVVIGDQRHDYPLGTDGALVQQAEVVGLPLGVLAIPTSVLAMVLPNEALSALLPEEPSDKRAEREDERLLLASALAARAADMQGLSVAIEALAAAITVPTNPVVHVHVPEQPAPIVNLSPILELPAAPAPVVNVDVHPAEWPAPIIEVNLPELPPPVVELSIEPSAPRRIEFDRDARGRIVSAEEVA